MEKDTRNTLRNVITQCRKLLEEAIREILEGKFGVHLDKTGKLTVESAAQMTHLSDEDQQNREQMIVHLRHIQVRSTSESASHLKDAFEQFVREVAFTHLNRLCAYKMMETRDLIREAVSRGVKSQGFLFYVADHPEDEALWSSGQVDLAFQHFLVFLGKSFAQEIPALFYEHDPANYLFPPHKTIEAGLDLINSEELQDIWNSDETIGWVYQYFTPKELREQARKESQAPRNSYELAFRNQFYTPRYVVEFLTDNTLGRIWYEMRNGDTILTEKCKYLVRDKDATHFQSASHLKQVEREFKAPRDIKILDPACGSGHFLLYCFDLLMEIYQEDYVRRTPESASHSEYMKQIPAMILRENLHGIDIDRRATQIAALALWLRAQRAYQELGIPRDERPKITKANIVCAEPMPGNEALLNEFLDTLGEDRLQMLMKRATHLGGASHVQVRTTRAMADSLGELVKTIWEKMQLAGEAGSLLKIEEELSKAIEAGRREWEEDLPLFRITEMGLGIKKDAEGDAKGATHFQSASHLEEDRTTHLKGASYVTYLRTAPQEELTFWDKAESLVLAALEDYVEYAANGTGLARRLFADDAVQGFDFVDLCRKRFDVVLMNPPFGAPSNQSKTYITKSYPRTKNDMYATFVECSLNHMGRGGMLGAITSRTGFFLSSFQKWREEILLKEAQPTVLMDLGYGVLDAAMVETAAYCLSKGRKMDTSLFLRLLPFDDKESKLIETINSLKNGQHKSFVYSANPDLFQQVPRSPFAYWVSDRIRQLFIEFPPFETEERTVKIGFSTSDDFRFVRAWWEILPEKTLRGIAKTTKSKFRQQTFEGQRWIPFAKGGIYSPYYVDLHLVVNWENDGEEIKSWVVLNPSDPGTTHWSRRVPNWEYFFNSGLTYPRRTTSRLSMRPLVAGAIFADKGPAVFVKNKTRWLALLQSSTFEELIGLQLAAADAAARSYEVGLIQRTPVPDVQVEQGDALGRLALSSINLKRSLDTANEISHVFHLPAILQISGETLEDYHLAWNEEVVESRRLLAEYQREIDSIVLQLYGLEGTDDQGENESLEQQMTETEEDEIETVVDIQRFVCDLISYTVGCVVGRWDIRIALNPELAPKLQDPFDPLPVCPPGMLVGTDGLPATKDNIASEEWLRVRPNVITLPPEDKGATHFESASHLKAEEYPLKIDWDGILVDDPDHPDDIIRRVREVLEVLFGNSNVRRTFRSASHVTPEEIEQEACKILGVKDLRDYFRKPGNGGFWMDHVKRYSKSRRKAPIYWLLQSSKKNYALWLYYFRLDKDILFKALINYVEPKLRLEESKLDQLRADRQAAGTGGSNVKQLERQIDKQEALLSELRDFEDKLRKVANLHLDFDLNDGVVLNIAPLWELVPWKEAKKYWEELLKGKYEWSSMAKQLREKELVK